MKTSLSFFLFIFSVESSPVAYIIQKNQHNPINLLGTSIIFTEKLVLSTKHPLSTFVVSTLCILPAVNLKDPNEAYIRNFCANIKTINFASTIAVIELEIDITFLYQINTAMIPSIPKLTSCKILFHERNHSLRHVTSQKLEPVAVSTNDGSSMDVHLKTGRNFCVQDNGLPLLCDSGVVGMFFYKEEETHCCVTTCSYKSAVTVVRFNEEVLELLKKCVKAMEYNGKSLEEFEIEN